MKQIILLLTFLLTAPTLQAQMFSVGESDSRPQRSSSNYIYLGYSPINFDYTGDESAVRDEERLDFEESGVTIGFETPFVNGSILFANKLTGSDDARFLKLNLYYLNSFNFGQRERFVLGVPLKLESNLTSVRNSMASNEFNQSVFSFGAGAFMKFRKIESWAFEVNTIPSYGFSSSNGGLFGGSNKSLTASARLKLLNLIGNRSLSIGYDYKLSVYDIDAENFDYDLNYHLFTMGISL